MHFKTSLFTSVLWTSLYIQSYAAPTLYSQVQSAIPKAEKQWSIGIHNQFDIGNRYKANVITLQTPIDSLPDSYKNVMLPISQTYTLQSIMQLDWSPYSRLGLYASIPYYANAAKGFQSQSTSDLNYAGFGDLAIGAKLNYFNSSIYYASMDLGATLPTGSKGGILYTDYNLQSSLTPALGLSAQDYVFNAHGSSTFVIPFGVSALNLHFNYSYQSDLQSISSFKSIQLQEAIEFKFSKNYGFFANYYNNKSIATIGTQVYTDNGWELRLALSKSLNDQFNDYVVDNEKSKYVFSYNQNPNVAIQISIQKTFDYNKRIEQSELRRQLSRGEKHTWLQERFPAYAYDPTMSSSIELTYDEHGLLTDGTKDNLYYKLQNIMIQERLIELHAWSKATDEESDIKTSAIIATKVAEYLMDHGLQKYRIRIVPHGKDGLAPQSQDSLHIAVYDLNKQVKHRLSTNKKLERGIVRDIVFNNLHKLVGSTVWPLDSIAQIWHKHPAKLELNVWYGEATHDHINKKVGLSRGETIKEYLIEKGISAEHISITSHGKGATDLYRVQQLGIKVSPMPIAANSKPQEVAQVKPKKKVK